MSATRTGQRGAAVRAYWCRDREASRAQATADLRKVPEAEPQLALDLAPAAIEISEAQAACFD